MYATQSAIKLLVDAGLVVYDSDLEYCSIRATDKDNYLVRTDGAGPGGVAESFKWQDLLTPDFEKAINFFYQLRRELEEADIGG
jgi:hypothetical protein